MWYGLLGFPELGSFVEHLKIFGDSYATYIFYYLM